MDYTLEDLQKQFQWLRTLRRKISKIKGKDLGNSNSSLIYFIRVQN